MVMMFFLAMLPIIWLIIALSGLKMPAFKACPIALLLTIFLSLIVWKMPFMDMFTGALEGAVMGIWPICLVIIAAIFTYNLTVYTKNMDLIKRMLTSVSMDKRILVLIIAWGFGGFMEGMAGFGTAVAIPASMLCGLGFNPIFAATVCLVANATPTAFGSIGIPTITAASITGLGASDVAIAAVTQLALMIVITPFLMVIMTGKSLKSLKGVGLITLISGLAFVIPEFLTAKFVGAELPVVIGSVCSMAATILASKFLAKKPAPDYALEEIAADSDDTKTESLTVSRAIRAWMPFILILVFLLLTSSLIPPIHNVLSSIKTSIQIYSGAGASKYTFTWVATPGVLIFIAAIIGGRIQKASFGEIFGVLGDSLKQMWKTVITIVSILATAKLMGYSGMINDIAALIVSITGSFYPLVAPLIGSIGTFVTGSATSSSVLFAGLQAQTAETLNMSPVWMAAANTAGATAGKIISPQSIAIAVAAANTVGEESKILNASIKYYIIFIVVFGLIAFFGGGLI